MWGLSVFRTSTGGGGWGVVWNSNTALPFFSVLFFPSLKGATKESFVADGFGEGGPYGLSKACVNAYTTFLATVRKNARQSTMFVTSTGMCSNPPPPHTHKDNQAAVPTTAVSRNFYILSKFCELTIGGPVCI